MYIKIRSVSIMNSHFSLFSLPFITVNIVHSNENNIVTSYGDTININISMLYIKHVSFFLFYVVVFSLRVQETFIQLDVMCDTY